jgi:hypothetical protein
MRKAGLFRINIFDGHGRQSKVSAKRQWDYLSNTGKMEWSSGVRIAQNGRTGTAERGECIASEGKFVLSGGEPAIADASGSRTTGHELTFYLANDSIVVNSGTKPQTQITPH